jgi:uncharacterized membrane protein
MPPVALALCCSSAEVFVVGLTEMDKLELAVLVVVGTTVGVVTFIVTALVVNMVPFPIDPTLVALMLTVFVVHGAVVVTVVCAKVIGIGVGATVLTKTSWTTTVAPSTFDSN